MFTSRTSRLRQALSRGALIGIVVVVIIIIAVGGYLALTSLTHTTGPTTPTSSTLGPKNPSQFVDEAIGTGAYDSLDPDYGFFTTDGYFANVFQGLVAAADNGTAISSTQVVPALASSYTVSAGSPICTTTNNPENCGSSDTNYSVYNFVMRTGTHFSNNDPVNAYTAWFSFVRVLYYNAGDTVGISNYAEITVNTTTDEPCFNGAIVTGGCGANIWPDGLMNALVHAGVPNNQNALTLALNQMLSNFNPNNSTQQAIMAYPDQAYVAKNSSVFTINLIEPYNLFPLALVAQWGAIVDPTYIDKNGGVQNNTGFACTSSECANFNNNGMPGTGPYEFNCPSQCPADHTQLELVKNTNYWANSGYSFTNATSGLSSTQLNMILKPATISNIIMKFGLQPSTLVQDFGANDAQDVAIGFPQIGELWSAFHANNPQYSFNKILDNFGFSLSKNGVGMNTQVYPTNITLLRQAIVHAINYSALEQQLFTYNGTSLGELFLPPVPPGFGPLDNPQNLPLYSYNITQAAILLNEAGNQNGFYTIPSSPLVIGGVRYTQLGNNKTGTLLSAITYAYVVPLTPEIQTQIEIFDQGLNQIGLTLSAEGLTTGVYDVEISSSSTTPNMAGVGWFSDWADPIYQMFYELGTTASHPASWPENSTLTHLLSTIPFETNQTLQIQQTEQAYQIWYQMATMIQTPLGVDVGNGNAFFVQPYVHGLLYSDPQSAYPYNLVTYGT